MMMLLIIATLSIYVTIPEELGGYVGGYANRLLSYRYGFYLFMVGYFCIAIVTLLLYLIARTFTKRLDDRCFKLAIYMFIVGLLLIPPLIGILIATVTYIAVILSIVNNPSIEHL